MRTGIRKLLELSLLGVGFITTTFATSHVTASSLNTIAPKNFTEVRLITPFTIEGLNPKVTVIKQVKGNCWTTSASNNARPNTWRCQAEQKTYDPCFINPIRPEKSVICLNDPWSNNAVEITLNSPLPSTKIGTFDQKSAQPWALELANGSYCTLITGPSFLIAGMKTRYQCKGAVVMGNIDKTHKQWTVHFLGHESLYMAQTQVKTAWY